MESKLLKATHSGIIKIIDKELPCAVLEDGTRLISKSAIPRAFDRNKRGRSKDDTRVPNMPTFLDAKNLQPFINGALQDVLIPIEYVNQSGRIAKGHKAEIIPLLCDLYLEARTQGVLVVSQMKLATISEIIVRSLSKIGIVALVDEATGYQEIRRRDALQQILDKYLTEEFSAWAKRFPDEFFKQIFRLRKWDYEPDNLKRPGIVGKYINDIVYSRLAPEMVEELNEINPKNEHGNRIRRHHQHLTTDIGHPALSQHIYALLGLMKASSDWEQFYGILQKAYPKKNEQLLLIFGDE